MLPRSSQLDAKIAQESPTYGQDRPKYSPRASNQTHQDPKIWPNALVLFVFSKDRFQDHQECSKKLPNWPQDNHLGPNLEALGAILAPTWRHLAPFGRDFGRSEPVQNLPKSAKTASWPFFFPRSPPGAPRHPPGIDFFNLQGRVFKLSGGIF